MKAIDKESFDSGGIKSVNNVVPVRKTASPRNKAL